MVHTISSRDGGLKQKTLELITMSECKSMCVCMNQLLTIVDVVYPAFDTDISLRIVHICPLR